MPAATVFFDLGDTLIFNSPAGVATRFADTLDVLQVLQERGWRIGLLSNQANGTTVPQVQSRLAAMGIARYVDTALITISTEIAGNAGKPARPIFDLALSKAGLAATPAQAVFVTEEAAHVAAARGFGWRAIVIKRGAACSLADGDCAHALAGLLAQLPAQGTLAGTNLDLAPPPKRVDGLWAVPVDIQRIDAMLSFDTAAQTAIGDATLQFRLGPHAGCPIFDLRQTPTSVQLDGAALAVTDIVPHDFGGGGGAELRVLARTLEAGSAHTLRVAYGVGLPQAPMVGSYLPQLTFSAGPRLVFNFGFTDLGPGRYVESFIPANLAFDQFELVLELRITGTAIAHQPVTNGELTVLGANHWRVSFPSRSTALSPMLELRAADALASASHTQVLPVSGTAVTVTAWKPAASAVNVATLASDVGGHLADNELSSGRYLHGSRFTAFVHTGGMEYDGATTSSPGPLRHEAFHSWWGRGLIPAGQADGWFDEAWTVYNENGAAGVQPLNFGDPPVTLSSRNPWVRSTPSASYSAGERLWKGLAAVMGVPALRARMNDFCARRNSRPVTTEALEAHLLASTGRSEVVDAFHRFVYGLPDPQPLPDLWLRDDAADGGAVPFGGRFWDSPDLWVRNEDDGGLVHQNPEAGQDNWLHARVRNRSSTAVARHLVLSFNTKFFAGSQFSYPADWLPAVTAAVAFDVGPGETRILKARWPRAQVPPAGTHPCLLAAVFSRFDAPVAGKPVWEQNNLAQKNLTVVNLRPDRWFVLPFVVAQLKPRLMLSTTIELRRPATFAALKASLVAPKAVLSTAQRRAATLIEVDGERDGADAGEGRERTAPVLDCGCVAHVLLPRQAAGLEEEASADDREGHDTGTLLREFAGNLELPFAAGERATHTVKLRPQEPTRLGLLFQLPADAPAGARFVLDVVQRVGTKVVGGVAVEVNVLR
jgi:hypothetical protein